MLVQNPAGFINSYFYIHFVKPRINTETKIIRNGQSVSFPFLLFLLKTTFKFYADISS